MLRSQLISDLYALLINSSCNFFYSCKNHFNTFISNCTDWEEEAVIAELIWQPCLDLLDIITGPDSFYQVSYKLHVIYSGYNI